MCARGGAGLARAAVRRAGGGVPAGGRPAVRAAARHGLVRERSSQRWAALQAAAVPVLLLLATEPPETKANNEAGLLRMSAALPGLDARFLTGWGHDLIGDGGPALASIIGEWIAALP